MMSAARSKMFISLFSCLVLLNLPNGTKQNVVSTSDPPSMTGTSPPPMTGTSPPPMTGTSPPPMTGTSPPPMTGTNPPPMTGTSPPPMTGTSPPPMTGTTPPPMTGTSPPPMTGTSPPSMTGTSPPSMTGTSPPAMTGTSPPPMNGTSPPPMTGTSPPPMTGTSPLPMNGTSPPPMTGTSPAPMTGTSPPTMTGTSPPMTGTSPPPMTSTSPPPVTSTSPPPVTITSPPSMTSTSPPSMTSTSPHPMTSTSPPPMTSTSPPSMTSTSPHPMTSTSPPPVTSTSPPPMTSTSPPPVTSTSPPPMTSTSPPSMTSTSPHPMTSTSPPPVTSTSPPSMTSTSPPPMTSTSPPPMTSTSPPPMTSTSPPSMTSTSPPPMTSTSPPSMTSTSPQPMTSTSHPPMTSSSPPPMTSASPPPMTSTSPPSMTSTSPPSMTSASPPPMTSTSPPSMTSTSPPSMTSTSPPSMTSTSPPSMTSTSPPPMTSTSPPPMTSTSPPPMTSTSPPPMTSTSPQPMTSTSPQPMTSTSPQPMTSTSPQPMTSTSPPSMISTSPPPMTSTSPQPMTSTSRPPMTGTSPEPMTGTSPLTTANTTPPRTSTTTKAELTTTESDVDGGLTEWSTWGPCSSVCQPGTKTRIRTCTNPPPVGNGDNCTGALLSETSNCQPNCENPQQCNATHCWCNQGYTFESCCCVDVDECATMTHTCDVTSRATCDNTPGSYTCTCKAGYQGDGQKDTCKVPLPIPWRDHLGVDKFRPIRIPCGLPLGNGHVYNFLHVSLHGAVTAFNKNLSAARDFAQVPREDLSERPNLKDVKVKAIIAIYWATTITLDDEDDRGVHGQVVTGKENVAGLLGRLTAWSTINTILDTPEWAAVITYWKVQWTKQRPEQTASYQLIIVTDYINTLIFFCYGDMEMKWILTLDKSQWKNVPIHVGVLVQDPDNSFSPAVHPASFALVDDKDKIEQMDVTVGSASGQCYMIRASNNMDGFVNHAKHCMDWAEQDDAREPLPDEQEANKVCADTLDQADDQWAYGEENQLYNIKCFKRELTLSGAADTWYASCCYYTTGSSAKNFVLDGTSVNHANLVTRQPAGGEELISDTDAYSSCCVLSNVKCKEYIKRRKASAIGTAPSIAAVDGDPHIVTLDGLNFTFNGHGEYTLVSSSQIIVQGRTAPTVNATATYFSAFAAQQIRSDGTTTDFIMAALNGNDFDIYRNRQKQELDFTGAGQQFSGVTVTKDSNSATLDFTPGLTVNVRAAEGMSYVKLIIPAKLKGTLRGLMGNFNGDTTDDLQYPNGTMIPSDSSDADIFPLGQSWAIKPEDSLFAYTGDETAETYGNSSFIPMFFDLDTMFGSTELRDAAIERCGLDKRECLFDVAQTGNLAVGDAIVISQEETADLQAKLENLAPEIMSNLTSIDVQSGQSFSAVISATDGNEADVLNFQLGTGAPPGISIHATSGMISWPEVSSNVVQNASVIVIVTDGRESATKVLAVNVCQCQAGSTCLYDQAVGGKVPCDCAPGMEGEQCERDIDGCSVSPCFQGVSCTDIAAPGDDYTCGDCPSGLIGDGRACADDDECTQSPSPCSHSCTNLPGSFLCTCPSGYVLTTDLRTCQEVDECARGDFTCDTNANCANMPGTYACLCKAGFINYDAGKPGDCSDLDECGTPDLCPINSVCDNSPGSYTCQCAVGYERNVDSNDCEDVDECVKADICHQICVNTVGSYGCECRPGYTLDTTDNTTCIPDEVCSTVQAATMCSNAGDVNPSCGVVNGATECLCPARYRLTVNKTCVDINECEQTTSQCNPLTSTCVNVIGDYSCECKPGYTSPTGNTYECQDINECTEMTANCDQNNGVCSNTDGSYTCSCVQGYTLDTDGHTCIDNDECALSATNGCDPNYGVCINIEGSYSCACQSGFTGDGYICADNNECAQGSLSGCAQGCTNNMGSYSCFCGSGYTLNSDGLNCDDYNECLSTSDNPCYDNDHCTNTVGSLTCSCPGDLVLVEEAGEISCVSETKCSNTTGCSDTCVVLNGQDVCQCPKGQTLSSDSVTCTPVNECLSTTTNRCQASKNVQCEDRDVGYECTCTNMTLFTQISADRCIDIDECIENTNTCPEHSLCENQEPGYRCNCKEGYTLQSGLCQDLDECSTDSHNCHQMAMCVNEPGTYSCSCNQGYTGDGFTCVDADECDSKDTHPYGGCDIVRGRGQCINYPGGYNCSCVSGYRLDPQGRLCDDVNECSSSDPLHACAQICENIPGGYNCKCAPGFVLAADGRKCTVGVPCSSNHTCTQLCAMVDEVETCSCMNNGYRLASDSKTCIDINECVEANPCIGNSSLCTNTEGGYNCTCSEGFRQPTDGVTCKDRDGGLSEWSTWDVCTVCGTGMRKRNRSCTNPTPVGRGAVCTGTLSETQPCDNCVSPTEQAYGVILVINGLSTDRFPVVSSALRNNITTAVNLHCNGAYFTRCCPGTGVRTSNEHLEFTKVAHVRFSQTFREWNSSNWTHELLVAKSEISNDLCKNGNLQSNRKKRGIVLDPATETALSADALQDILEEPEVIAQMENTIEAAFPGQTIQISIEPVSTSTMSPTTSVGPTAAPGGLAHWAIAIIVIAVILVVVVIIALIIVLMKRPTKVGSQKPDNSNNTFTRGMSPAGEGADTQQMGYQLISYENDTEANSQQQGCVDTGCEDAAQKSKEEANQEEEKEEEKQEESQTADRPASQGSNNGQDSVQTDHLLVDVSDGNVVQNEEENSPKPQQEDDLDDNQDEKVKSRPVSQASTNQASEETDHSAINVSEDNGVKDEGGNSQNPQQENNLDDKQDEKQSNSRPTSQGSRRSNTPQQMSVFHS